MNPKNGRWEKVPGTISPDKREFLVPKLKEGEEYMFRVMAENKHGTSEPLETTKPTKAKNPYGKKNPISRRSCLKIIKARDLAQNALVLLPVAPVLLSLRT